MSLLSQDVDLESDEQARDEISENNSMRLFEEGNIEGKHIQMGNSASVTLDSGIINDYTYTIFNIKNKNWVHKFEFILEFL